MHNTFQTSKNLQRLLKAVIHTFIQLVIKFVN